MRTRSLILLLVTSLAGSHANAQISINPVQDYINKTTLLNNILSNARAADLSQRAQTNGQTPGRAPGAGKGPAASPTAFQPSSRSLLPAVLAARTGGNSAQQQEAARFFESLLDLYRKTAEHDGFPANDVAYAMEYFVVNGYMTYHDLHDVPYEKDPRVKRGKDSFDRITIINEKKTLKPTLLQERAVYAQIQQSLAENAQVRQMSDQNKQELTELLAIMFGVTYSAYLKGVNNEDDRLIEQAHRSAQSSLERLIGAPIDRIKIDESGLRK